MTPASMTLLKLIQKCGWDVRVVFAEGSVMYEARKGVDICFGTTPENLFDVWSGRPEVLKEIFGIDVRNYEFEVPVEAKHDEVEDQG